MLIAHDEIAVGTSGSPTRRKQLEPSYETHGVAQHLDAISVHKVIQAVADSWQRPPGTVDDGVR
jgi:hypothetical protein